jgi:glycosyltransferase involved in cell wall biosynthesis
MNSNLISKKISIIIALFNEEKTIIEILNSINKTKKNNYEYEIIVINDGSTDNSLKLLEENLNLFNKILSFANNKGKGFAIKEGLKIATGNYVIFQDADLEYDPNDINYFCETYDKVNADLIIGSRMRYREYNRSHKFMNLIGNKIITLLFNIIHNCTFTDIYSCYVSFRRNLLDPLKLKTNGFEQQAEILGLIIKKAKKSYEIPVNYSGRDISEGKKIRFYHIFPVIYQIIKSRFI